MMEEMKEYKKALTRAEWLQKNDKELRAMYELQNKIVDMMEVFYWDMYENQGDSFSHKIDSIDFGMLMGNMAKAMRKQREARSRINWSD
jgi:hypothetical protein